MIRNKLSTLPGIVKLDFNLVQRKLTVTHTLPEITPIQAAHGKGTLSTQNGVLKETSYSYRSRLGDGTEMNPEELIAAAHAGCFTMALSAFLGNAGFTPERLSTKATLSFEQVEGKWTITDVHLDLAAKMDPD